jgi:alpha-glucoside transport system permease protein
VASVILSTVITVIAGIAIALVVYWVLNKIAELLPQKWEDRIKPYLYVAPAIAAIGVYLVYPTIITIINAFKNDDSSAFVGFANFKKLLTTHDFQQTLINTLLWIIIVPLISIVVGLTIATLGDRLSLTGEKTAKTIIFMPMAISAVGAATVWKFVYSANPKGTGQVGLLNAIVTGFGGNPIAWVQNSHFHLDSMALMAMLLWGQIGFSMVLLSAAIKGVPVETIEASRIDGANEWQIFGRVIVPQIRGTIVTVLITVIITAMKVFDTIYVMTDGQFNTNVVGLEFYNQLNTNFNNGLACAIVVLLLVAVVPVVIYQVRHFRSEEAV